MSSGAHVDEERLDAALDELLAITDADKRAQWLVQARRHDPTLAARIEELLLQAEHVAGLASGPGTLANDLVEQYEGLQSGARLGVWRILRPLGRGGMGRVYLAERADGAFEKRVAIKVLRRELNLPAGVLQRERALLARLEHPGVTRLLDGGLSDEGDTYLVMEHVEGTPLPHWCRKHNANRAQCLEKFLQVADVVAYAHQQLVVHGDIKPGNVLVDDHDRVRLLDFGIARLVSESSHAKDAIPQALTPAYAAPECLDGRLANVSSDIYSLGALLRFLLHEPTANIDQDTAPSAMPEVSVAHLPRDLAAIIGRAMADAPRERYSDVRELCHDLTLYQERRPVAARAGGTLYRTCRFLSRRWLAAGAATTLLMVLLVSAIVVSWQNRIVRAERDRAQLEVTRSQTVLEYLIGVLGKSGSGDDSTPPSVRKLFADSLKHFDLDFTGDPATRQQLLSRLGELHVQLMDYSTAETLLQRFLDNEHGDSPIPVRTRVLDNLALVRLHQGKLDEAATATDQALALLATSASDTRGLRSELLVTKAQIQRHRGDSTAAVSTLREALSLRLAESSTNNTQAVVVRNSLAVALMRTGQLQAALDQYRLIDAALQSSGRGHSPDAANIYNNYASVSFAYGLFDDAERLFSKALVLQKEVYGPSAGQAALLNNYGKLKLARGDVDAGASMINDAVRMMQRYAGEASVDAQLVRISLGNVALARKDPQAAEEIYRSVHGALKEALGANHPLTTRLQAAVLTAQARNGTIGAASAVFDATIEVLSQSPANRRPLAALQCARAELALVQHALKTAADSAGACLKLRRTTQSEHSPALLEAQFLNAEVAIRQGDTTAILRRAHARQALLDQLGAQNPQVQRLRALASTN